MMSMSVNPWFGHTIAETLEQIGILTNCQLRVDIVDICYQGVEIPSQRILSSGQR